MATNSNRSSGTQHNKRGVTQGVTLVDPITGLPVDVIKDNAGVNRIAVDANLTADNITVQTDDLNATDDAVRIEDPNTGAHVRVEPDGSINTNVVLNAAQDNVGISDQSSGNKLKVNADGSINVSGTGSAPGTPTIFNVSVPLANTEVSQSLPTGTTKFLIKVRDNGAKMQLAFLSGQSSTDYITVDRGVAYSEDNISLTGATIYFQLNKPGKTVEILTWS